MEFFFSKSDFSDLLCEITYLLWKGLHIRLDVDYIPVTEKEDFINI